MATNAERQALGIRWRPEWTGEAWQFAENFKNMGRKRPQHLTLNQSMRLWHAKENWNETNRVRRQFPHGHPNQANAQAAYLRAVNAHIALQRRLARKHGMAPVNVGVNMWRTSEKHRRQVPLMKEVKNAHWKRQLLRELVEKAWNPTARMNRRLRRPYAKSASPVRARASSASPRRVKSAPSNRPKSKTPSPLPPHKRKMTTENIKWLATSNATARPSNSKRVRTT